MSENPYTPSATPGSSNAHQKVQLPAILLMVAGGVTILAAGIGLIMNLLGAGMGAAAGDPEMAAANLFSGVVGMIFNVIGLGVGGLGIFAGMKMKNLQSYGLVMAGTILNMIPCISCCLVGLPIGIYVLIVLNDAEVKGSFK